ncbi:MAG: hypothetical protein ABJA85_04530 [Bacteroidota bacterium]
MNAQINQLVKSLLQKDSIEQCSVQELQQYADRHPYFGAAQLLLTKKLQAENSDRYDEQLQKTFLFFHNPLWVEQLLNDTGNGSLTATEKKIENFVQKEIAEDIVDVNPVEKDLAEPVAAEIKETSIEIESEKITEPVLEIPALKIEPVDVAKTELVFEPFHTVDYFASQGIKFKEEEKPKDKFGQQLKSFTDWLKTMKRFPVTEIVKPLEPHTEQKVVQLAEHSIEDREIVTEAMAEVWEKQGNAGKAIEVYSKLSLLDPSKNRYFAAKIEDLKKIN